MCADSLSEVFSVEELVALSEDDVSGIAKFVLLAHIAHVEELLVVEDKQ